MKNKALHHTVFFIFTLIIVFTCTGCYDYRDIEDTLIIMGAAYDLDENTEKYCLNIETIRMEMSGKSMEMTSELVVSEGNSISEAYQSSIEAAGKEAFKKHKKVIVISKKVADNDMFSVIDVITRNAGSRMSIYLAVSRENTAAEIMRNKMPGYNIVSNGIYEAFQNYSASSTFIPIQVYEANTELLTDGISLVLPTVFLADNNGEKAVEISGSAIFKEAELVGYLDADETKYLMFVRDLIKGGVITMTDPQTGKNIAMNISGNQTNINPEVTDTRIKITIETKTQVTLAEVDYYLDTPTKKEIERLTELSEKTIKENILAVVSRVGRDFGTDSFGFGEKVKQKTPEIWKSLSGEWDSYFVNMQVEVQSEVTITNTGWRS